MAKQKVVEFEPVVDGVDENDVGDYVEEKKEESEAFLKYMILVITSDEIFQSVVTDSVSSSCSGISTTVSHKRRHPYHFRKKFKLQQITLQI